MARKLTAFARLGALCHLDLNLIGARKIFGTDTKTSRGNLFDFRAHGVACLQGNISSDAISAQLGGERSTCCDTAFASAQFVAITQLIFTAFAGVGFATDTVHGDCQDGMRFGGNRAQRHRTCCETLDDFFGGLDFVKRNRAGGIHFEFKQTAQRHVATALVVDQLCILFVSTVVIRARGVLQLCDGVRRPHVLFAAYAVGIFTARVKRIGQDGIVAKRGAVCAQCFFRDLEDSNALDRACSAREVFVDQGCT